MEKWRVACVSRKRAYMWKSGNGVCVEGEGWWGRRASRGKHWKCSCTPKDKIVGWPAAMKLQVQHSWKELWHGGGRMNPPGTLKMALAGLCAFFVQR